MLVDYVLAANIAVMDMKIARKFYEEILDLNQVGSEGDAAIMLKSGRSNLIIYQSQYARASY